MQKADIETHLTQLGEELTRRGVKSPVRLLLIGGAFMLTQIGNRQATDDIDNSFRSPLVRTLKDAAQVVARKNNLKSNWINDLMGDFLKDTGAMPEGTFWKRYGPLELFLPPREYILALKFLAGRGKDDRDIRILCQQLNIKSRFHAQELVNRYIPDQKFQHLNNLDDTLDRFFPASANF